MLRKMLVVLFILMLASVALAQESLTVGTPLDGELTETEMDFTVALTSGSTYEITLNSSAFDARLYVLDPSGEPVDDDDDSGDGTNSRLVLTAAEDGDYTVRVTSFAGSGSGAFTVAVNEFELNLVEVGGSVELTVTDAAAARFDLAGADGLVVDLIGDFGDADVRIVVNGPDGFQVANDDDGGPGNNPFVRGLDLSEPGNYAVSVEAGFSLDAGSEVTGTVTVAESNLTTLELGTAVSVTSDARDYDVVLFEAAAGTTYRVTVTASAPAYINVELGYAGAFFPNYYSAGNATRLSFDAPADAAGLARIKVSQSVFADEMISMEVMVEEVGQ